MEWWLTFASLMDWKAMGVAFGWVGALGFWLFVCEEKARWKRQGQEREAIHG